MAENAEETEGNIVVGGIKFIWLHRLCELPHSDYALTGIIVEELEYGTPWKAWRNKSPRQVGKQVRVGDLMLVLDEIFHENGGAIPVDAWRARQELEQKILQLTE